MNNSKVILHNGLYDFIKAAQKAKQFKNTSINECDLTTVDESNLTSDTYQRLSPIIPKTFSIKIEDTSISAVRENNSNDFNAKLELFTVYIIYVMHEIFYFLTSLFDFTGEWKIQFH